MSGYWALLIGIIAAAVVWIMIAAQELFREQEQERDDSDI